MKLRRVIKRVDRNKCIVLKYEDSDLNSEPVHKVIYAFPSPRVAMVYYIMQFTKQDFMWERYPKHIDGIFQSTKVKDVWYYDRLDGFILVSRPMTSDDLALIADRSVRKERMRVSRGRHHL